MQKLMLSLLKNKLSLVFVLFALTFSILSYPVFSAEGDILYSVGGVYRYSDNADEIPEEHIVYTGQRGEEGGLCSPKPFSFSSIETPQVGYTGDLVTGLPVLTVQGRGGLDLPLGLNYKSGISVQQQASWVGLGWDLNPGSIVRNVNYVKDENPDGYFYYCGSIDDDCFTLDDYHLNGPFVSGVISYTQDPGELSEGQDLSEFHLQNWDAAKVEADVECDFINDECDIRGWKVIDKSGNSYIYGNYEGNYPAAVKREKYRKFYCSSHFADVDANTEWYLSAVLASNYEDVNSNGVPDDNDYGNWIKLNYDLSTNLIHYWSPDCGKLYNGWLGYDNEGGNMDMVLVFQGINLQKL